MSGRVFNSKGNTQSIEIPAPAFQKLTQSGKRVCVCVCALILAVGTSWGKRRRRISQVDNWCAMLLPSTTSLLICKVKNLSYYLINKFQIYAETSCGALSTWGIEHKVTKAHNTNVRVVLAFAKQF